MKVRRFTATIGGRTSTATQDVGIGSWHVYDDRYAELVADIDPWLTPEQAAAYLQRERTDWPSFWTGATDITAVDVDDSPP